MNQTDEEDEEPFPATWLFFMSTHHELLGWDEDRFWNATLRKLLLVWDEYTRYMEVKHGSPDKSGDKQKPTKASSIDELNWL